MSKTELSRMKQPLVPLATLIGRELRNGKTEKPFVKYGQAGLAKKGEDYFLIKTDCERVPGDSSTLFSVFAVGPLRCWPGGLCLSRSIGDTDVGEYIVPIPHVKQVKLSNAGGRLIIASDGIWDTLSSETAAKSCRGVPAELAAKLVVKEALRSRGLKDDTTCLVVDIIPSDYPMSPMATTPRKKQNMLSSLLFGKKSPNSTNKGTNKLSAVGVVEELFEEGSAMLTERLGKDVPSNTNSGIYRCAVCLADQPTGDGLSVNTDHFITPVSKPREGLFLCANCQKKKDAMEGKRS